jgi:Mrp family chromosome partitioning ATPase
MTSMDISTMVSATAASASESMVAHDPSSATPQAGARRVVQRPGAEVYDAILWRLQHSLPPDCRSGMVVGMLGCARSMGVSTVVANVAVRAADHGLGRVLLVDANFSQPRLAKLMRQRRREGLADLLAGTADLDDVVTETSVPDLHLLPAGNRAHRKSVGLDPTQSQNLVQMLRERFDTIFFDLSVVKEMNRAVVLAQAMDGCVFVARSDSVRVEEARRTLERLRLDQVSLVGTVMTRQRSYLPRWLDRCV